MLTKKALNIIKVLILSDDSDTLPNTCRNLSDYGYDLSTVRYGQDTISNISKLNPDVLFITVPSPLLLSEIVGNIKETFDIPIVVILNFESMGQVADHLMAVDDFIIAPFETGELDLRVKRLLRKRNTVVDEQIRCGDLLIDLATCEVTLSGNIVSLTFKEYELLKFLVNNQGRVFSRDVLLDKVWGYDYYGGDRTVDVHVRRLRSKIEDANHSFIDTVRNIGYRFRIEH
jgi:two-component system, OmpR family, alkaline phosphatase synthesis response regulator PhoP